MPNLRGSEWLVLILIIVLLFGAKRLPDAARGLGRSLRIFKAETKGLTEDDPAQPPSTTVQQVQQVPPAIQPTTPAAPPVAPPAAAAPVAEPTTAAVPPADPGANADR